MSAKELGLAVQPGVLCGGGKGFRRAGRIEQNVRCPATRQRAAHRGRQLPVLDGRINFNRGDIERWQHTCQVACPVTPGDIEKGASIGRILGPDSIGECSGVGERLDLSEACFARCSGGGLPDDCDLRVAAFGTFGELCDCDGACRNNDLGVV